jgi:hypothetical protein
MQEEGRQFLSDGFVFVFCFFFPRTSCQLSSGMFNSFRLHSITFEDYLPGLSGPWTYTKSRQTIDSVIGFL